MRTYNPEFLYLTTTGWKSGSPHEIEIWYVVYEDCYFLCAEHREKTHWVQNIRRNTAVSFWVNGQTFQGAARPVDPAAQPDLVSAISPLFQQKYDWSDGLFVELRPNNG